MIIDEFADLAQEDFIGFLNRASSSRMSVVVAHQEICDLQRISPEFASRLMGKTLQPYTRSSRSTQGAQRLFLEWRGLGRPGSRPGRRSGSDSLKLNPVAEVGAR